jgi:hypothetical protein
VTEQVTEKKKRLQKKSKIEYLNPDLRDEIEQKIVNGQSSVQISGWLKQERHKNIGTHCVSDYRKNVLGVITALKDTHYAKAVLGAKEKIDALLELYKLVQLQMKRLSIGLKLEEEKSTMSGIVDKGVATLGDILKSILGIEMDLGLRARISSGDVSKGMSDEALRELLERVMGQNEQKENESTPGTSNQ